MKREKLFKKTIKVLIKSYLENTLIHNSCSHCAVGNLVRANIGDHNGKWFDYMYCENTTPTDLSQGLAQIKSTGYLPEELRRIEVAFEGESGFNDDGYSGLLSVFDVLANIHELDDRGSYKQEFQDALDAKI